MNWIFQGNPDYFEIDSYLNNFDIVNWTVRQKHYANEMGIGDRVFFWRASGKDKLTSGILAIGEIIDVPKVYVEDAESLKYWKNGGGDVAALRVLIKVTHRLPVGTIYPKTSIIADPFLNNLKIIKLANHTNYKLSEAEAGALYIGFKAAITQNMPQLTSHSWTIESQSLACKILDKSAFLHRGTGIPKEIRSFFLKDELQSGQSKTISLSFQGKTYAAHIDMEGQDTARTRLFWNADFTSLLKETFPHHYHQFSKDQTPDAQVILRLKRTSGYESYDISFAGEISEKSLNQDIQSEDIEENGPPQKEGRVVEYYGKRYERSAINRQQAIKIHGLSCHACGFNFEKIYGARGADYIEVHHRTPIHTYEQEQHVDPKTDLVTVCSNCHRMMHRDPNNVLSIEDLKGLIFKFDGADFE